MRLALLRATSRLLRRGTPAAGPLGDRPRVLVLRPDHLGDVLLSRPALEALARALPGAELTLAVGPWGRPALGPVARGRLLLCPFPGFGRSPIGPLQPYLLLLRYRVLLRRSGPFDLALILRPDHWWGALLASLAGIPVRVGYATPETLPFLTVALDRVEGRHVVEEALLLAEAAAGYAGTRRDRGSMRGGADDRLPLPRSATPADRAALAAALQAAGVGDGERLLVLHPGAGSPLKSWPLPHLAATGAELAAMMGARVVVTGSAGERALAARLCRLLPPGAVSLAGLLDWGALEALLRRAALVLGVDSGPLHLAVAAGTPSVALFGPADPLQFGPWGSAARHRVVHAELPCRPCRRLDRCRIEPHGDGPPPCMRGIGVAEVVAAGRSALHEGRACSGTAD